MRLDDWEALTTTFKMPAGNIVIRMKLSAKLAKLYPVEVMAGKNGSAMATVDGEKIFNAAAGAQITLTATVDEGYEFEEWSVFVLGDESIYVDIADDEALVTTFTMPESGVIVEARFAAFVASGTTGALTWILTGSGRLTISGEGAMPDYGLRYLYDNHFTSSCPWYPYWERIKTVVIEDGVTSIGDYAFYDCASLTSITIPESVTTIGGMAFYECTSLTSITIPDSVTSIGNYAFYHCYSLTSVSIPDSVTSIGDEAFYRCTSLTSITIPDSVTSIVSNVFAYCTSLTSVTLGNGVKSIAGYAFYGCEVLASVNIPNSVTSIGERAFFGCSSLASITIPDGVTSIGDCAFNGCSSLKSITIPAGVTSIGINAFQYCISLTSINVSADNQNYTSVDGVLFNKDKTSLICYPAGKSGAYLIPDSVTSIGSWDFDRCTSLTSITIPDSVTSIGDYAFNGCSYLKSVTIMRTTPPSLGYSNFTTFYDTLYVPKGCVNAYKANAKWSEVFSYIVEQE